MGVWAPCPTFGERWTLQMVLLKVIMGSTDLLTASRWEMSRLRHCPFCVCHETVISQNPYIPTLPLHWYEGRATHSIQCSVRHKESRAILVLRQSCLKPFRLRRKGIPGLLLPFLKTLVDDMVNFLGFVSFYKIKHCYYREKILMGNKLGDWKNSTICSFHLGWLAKIPYLTQQIWQV